MQCKEDGATVSDDMFQTNTRDCLEQVVLRQDPEATSQQVLERVNALLIAVSLQITISQNFP